MAGDAERTWVDSMPAAYERYLVPTVFRPFAVDLARRVAAYRPSRVLELAAGTGVVTRELVDALPDADVVATDLNEAMVGLGRERVPEAAWQPADALDLPFDDGEFDAVVCQFGVMFYPDKPRGFAEAKRVLGGGGRFLANTWADLSTHTYESAVIAAFAQIFPADPPTFLAVTPHGYHDVETIAADLTAGGFQDAMIRSVTVDSVAASAADLAAGYCNGTPMRAEILQRGDLAKAQAALEVELTERLGAGPISGQMAAYVIDAART